MFNKTNYWFGDSLSKLNSICATVRLDSVLFHAVAVVDPNSGIGVVKTDLEGNVLAKRLLMDSSFVFYSYTANVMTLTSDSSFVICGGRGKFNTNNINGYLIKFDFNLDTVWTLTHDMPDSLAGCQQGDTVVNWFAFVKETMDGNYLIGGEYDQYCIDMNRYGHLLKVNKNGEILWTRTYDNIRGIYDIALTPDSGFVFPDFNMGYWLNKTDKNGNVQWRIKISSDQHVASGQIAMTSNNEIVTFAPYIYEYNPYTFYGHMHIVKYDLNGNKLWDKKYSTYERIGNYGLLEQFELEILPDGDIVAAGTASVAHETDSMKGGYKGFLMRFNNQGDSLWCKYYNFSHFNSACQFLDLVLMDDGGFLAVGDFSPHDQSYQTGCWLVRTDSMGKAPGAYTLDIKKYLQKQQGGLEVYPNPGNNHFYVEGVNGSILQVFSQNGRKLFEQELNTGRNKIEMGEYLYGVYYLRLIDEKQRIVGITKWIKR
ncbi:MAG: T9SS type A sorting domain-containing protein [Bacteroidales bacterium]|nr:T9SS type A sorting domain-containing protein [Bacteroidales bacterium]